MVTPIVLGVLASYLEKKGEGTALFTGLMCTAAILVMLMVGVFIDAALRHFGENRNLHTLLAGNPPAEKIGPPRDDWIYTGVVLVFGGAAFVALLTLIVAFSRDCDISLWFGMPAAMLAVVSLAFGFGRIERYALVSRAYAAARAREDAAHGLPVPARPPLKALFFGLAIWIVPALGLVLAVAHLQPSGAFYAPTIIVGAFLFFVGQGALGAYMNAREKWTRWQNARAALRGVSAPDCMVLMRGLMFLALAAAALGLSVAAMEEADDFFSTAFCACGIGFALFARSFLSRYAWAHRRFRTAVEISTTR